MGEYHKPEVITDSMGGEEGKLDERMQEIMTLLHYVPDSFQSILDIGIGGANFAIFS